MSTLETSSPSTQLPFPTSNGKIDLGQVWAELEDRVRRQPNQYLLIALLLGYLLQSLPVRAFLTLVLRLVLVLIKPTLVVLAGANLYRLISERQQQQKPAIITPNSGANGG
jgi:hypothetical protein